MKVIILAAGRGRRLPKKISKIPKSLLQINNKSLIERQIDIFKSYNINQIAIVTGFKRHLFKKFKLHEFYNKKWNTTNMVYSLSKAKRWLLNDECIVTYGDIIFEKKELKKIINSRHKLSILFDKNWKKLWKKRFNNPLTDAETFDFSKKKYLKEIGKKTDDYSKIKGQFMGILKFKPIAWKKFDLVNKRYFKKNKKVYTTDILNSMVKNENFKIKVLEYKNKWSEIDNKKDIDITNKLFK